MNLWKSRAPATTSPWAPTGLRCLTGCSSFAGKAALTLYQIPVRTTRHSKGGEPTVITTDIAELQALPEAQPAGLDELTEAGLLECAFTCLFTCGRTCFITDVLY